MHRKAASVPLALITAVTIGCQSHPPPAVTLADMKREQEKRLFSECIAEHRVLYRGNSNADYSSLTGRSRQGMPRGRGRARLVAGQAAIRFRNAWIASCS